MSTSQSRQNVLLPDPDKIQSTSTTCVQPDPRARMHSRDQPDNYSARPLSHAFCHRPSRLEKERLDKTVLLQHICLECDRARPTCVLARCHSRLRFCWHA